MKTINTFFVLLISFTLISSITSQDNPAYNNLQITDYIFNPVTSHNQSDFLIPVWSSGAPKPTYSYNAGAFSFIRNDTGWVYVVGGDLTGAGVLTQINERYNVNTDAWTTMAPYPVPPGIWYTSGATIGNTGYICGGLTGGSLANTTTQVCAYNIITNTWSIKAPLPQARAMHGVVSYQDSLLYVAAGFNNTGSSQSNVYLYNSISNTWRSATSLPGTRMGGAFSRNGDTLMYMNGTTGVFNGTVTNTNYVGLISQIDRASISWTTKAPYPGTARYRQQGQNWSCKGVIISGGTSAAGYTPAMVECYVYSPGADIWTIMPPLLTARTAHMTGAVTIGNNIWKFVNVCGYNGSNVLTTDILSDTINCIPISGVITICKWNSRFKPISDFNTTFDTIFVVLNPGSKVVDVNVRLDTILHTFDADLDISLSHGSINNLDLSSDNGGSGQNYIACTLNDSAAASITTAVAPMTGIWRPEASMNGWYAAFASGLWRLQVADDEAGDEGYLVQWCITIMYDVNLISIENNNELIPKTYSLLQNYPNPFNPETRITYMLPKAEIVKLVVYDILGKQVVVLQNGFKPAGTHIIDFNASELASGVYFYRIEARQVGSSIVEFTDVKKMLLLK